MNGGDDIDLNCHWPGAARVAVAMTFDVDAESPYLGMGDNYVRLLSTMSDARLGIRRGMPKLLALLHEYSTPATFCVPGDTAHLASTRHRRYSFSWPMRLVITATFIKRSTQSPRKRSWRKSRAELPSLKRQVHRA